MVLPREGNSPGPRFKPAAVAQKYAWRSMTSTDEIAAGRIAVVVVTGPTASGKSELALELAERFDGEIVNADSMQIYRYMDIGTAKPSLEERARVPHHLFDTVLPDADYSAGRFGEEARSVAEEIHRRGRLVLLTGGTGLYIRAFLHGLIATGPADAEFREALEQEHAEALAAGDSNRLHRRLAEVDQSAAERIHPHDARRTIRALEIIEQSGRPASQIRRDHGFSRSPFNSLHLAIDPGVDIVSERIETRCQEMIDAGLLREVRALRNRGYGAELRSMQGIGYRHMNPVVDGVETLLGAGVAMTADTRRFARRQRTWLRKVSGAIWLDPRRPSPIFEAVEKFSEEGP